MNILCAVARGAGETLTVTDWGEFDNQPAGGTIRVFGRRAQAGDSNISINFSGATAVAAVILGFDGTNGTVYQGTIDPTALTATSGKNSGLATVFDWSGHTPGEDNALVLRIGKHNKTSLTPDNFLTDDVAGWTQVVDYTQPQAETASGVCFVVEYQIQTAAQAISAGGWTSGSDPNAWENLSLSTIVLSIKGTANAGLRAPFSGKFGGLFRGKLG